MKRGKVRLNLPSSPKGTGNRTGGATFNNPRISPPGRGRPPGPGPARMLVPTPSRTDTVDSDLAITNRGMEDITFRFRNPSVPDLRPTIKFDEINVRYGLEDSERLARRDVQAPATHSLITDESLQVPDVRLRNNIPQPAQQAATTAVLAPSIESIISAAHRRDSLLFGGNAGTQATAVVETLAPTHVPVSIRAPPVAHLTTEPTPPEVPVEIPMEASRTGQSGRRVLFNMSQNPTITQVVEDEERIVPPEKRSRPFLVPIHSVAQPDEDEEIPEAVTAAIQRLRSARGELPAPMEVAVPKPSLESEEAPRRAAMRSQAPIINRADTSTRVVEDETHSLLPPVSTRKTPSARVEVAQPTFTSEEIVVPRSTQGISRPVTVRPTIAQPQWEENITDHSSVVLATAPLNPVPRLRERVVLPAIEDNITPTTQLQRLSAPPVQQVSKPDFVVPEPEVIEKPVRHKRVTQLREAVAQVNFSSPNESRIEPIPSRTARITPTLRNHLTSGNPILNEQVPVSDTFHSKRVPLLQSSLQREIGTILDEALDEVVHNAPKRTPTLIPKNANVVTPAIDGVPSFTATLREQRSQTLPQHAGSANFVTPIATPTPATLRKFPTVLPPIQVAHPDLHDSDEEDPITLLERRSKITTTAGRTAQPHMIVPATETATVTTRLTFREPLRYHAEHQLPVVSSVPTMDTTQHSRPVLRVTGAPIDTNLGSISHPTVTKPYLRETVAPIRSSADHTLSATSTPVYQAATRVSRIGSRPLVGGFALHSNEEQPPTPTIFRVQAREHLSIPSGEQHSQVTPQAIDDERRSYIMNLPTPTRQAPRASLHAGEEQEGERRNQRVVLNGGRGRVTK